MSSMSSYFPAGAMFYSYGTCGGATNTFDSWLSAGMPAGTCSLDQAQGMVTTLEGYLENTATSIELAHQTQTMEPARNCAGHPSCPV